MNLDAIIKRQIVEGVQAVVKLTRTTQNSGKIPLQVFDRSGGASNVNFSGKLPSMLDRFRLTTQQSTSSSILMLQAT